MQNAEVLAEVFPGFLQWWRDWQDSAKIILAWYLEANIDVLAEKKVILTQVALELISWILFVEKEQTVSPKDFDKFRASNKLKKLLSKFKIPLEIPPNSPTEALGKLAADEKWQDGPHAFTDIRNGLVHPKNRKKIFDAPSEAKIEICDLGLWYLELLLIAIFDYKGRYSDRRYKCRWAGETQLVPWVEPEQLHTYP